MTYIYVVDGAWISFHTTIDICLNAGADQTV